MKIYIPNKTNSNCLGGGWTFLRNLEKGIGDRAEFVNTWQECDIILVFSITTIDKTELYDAINAGKKMVLRVDNIPRKSRNSRQSPVNRLNEFGDKASAVIYQSEWCKDFAGYFIYNDNEYIINNGVDTDIFNQKDKSSDGKTYLYLNYNDNPNKRFDEAIYRFEMMWRQDNDIKLIIGGNAPRIYLEHPEYNWDLNVEVDVTYVGIMRKPDEIAILMKQCDYLLYPSFAEAYPNTLLEAMACGLDIECMNSEGGTIEAYTNSLIAKRDIDDKVTMIYKVKTIKEMADEYLEVFNDLLK